MNSRARSYIYILIAAALWGCIGVFFKLLSSAGLDALQSVAVRVIISAVIYTLWLLATDRRALKIRLRDFPYFIGTGICSLVFFNWCYFNTIERSGITVAVVLLYTAPIFVMLMSAAVFRERITNIKVIALIITFAGCVLVTGALSSRGRIGVPALLFGLGSGFGYALYSIFGKLALRKHSSETVTAYSFIFGAVGILPFVHFREVSAALSSAQGAVGAVCIAVLCCILPYIFYTAGLRGVEPGRASMMATLEPVVGSVLGMAVYREEVTAAKIIGVLLVVGAICLLSATDEVKGKTAADTPPRDENKAD
ncbi:MAG: EamA family transporter [Oscillospiraceae bacterium]|nr:EamA family transporter [Oscillospiraceae bacterium]